MLLAPAGYGKTTLAEQWVVRDGRRGTWFTARSSSTDVAALALGIAKSASSIVPDCEVRLRTHMRAVPAPADNEQTLAEILGEDLAEWPSDAWLVIDDYHEIAQEPKAEAFIDALVALSPVQFLIASRVRPSWVTTKHRLYGEILEVTQTALAMDTREAADVLVERGESAASGLAALANGWPAVIGLAGVSSAEIEHAGDELPESLYRFFADEVFSALGLDVQEGLATLAVAPVVDSELATALLGPDSGEAVCTAAIGVGLLVEREGRLDLHPLARAFLEERGGHVDPATHKNAAAICLAIYRERRDWDAAFELVARSQLTDEVEKLMRLGLDGLLDTARLPTLERWCDFARAKEVDAPIFALARAEVMLRRGRQVEAMAHAEAAASADDGLAFRALLVAGRAAHLASRETDALAHYERAEKAAASDENKREAKWGQLMCLADLELPSAAQVFDDLASSVTLSDPRDFVRAATYALQLQLRLGRSLDLDEADLAHQLLPAVGDALVRSAFLSVYTTALALSARYDDALVISRELLEISQQCRLDFALPYALAGAAMAHTGLRQWQAAESAALEALARAKATKNSHQNERSSRLKHTRQQASARKASWISARRS